MEEQKGAVEAEEFLEATGFNELPIKPDDVVDSISCSDYPVEIRYERFSVDSFLGKAVGVDSSALIIVNTNTPNLRRRNFTASHEIGHVCMHIMQQHKLDFSCGKKELSSQFDDPFERQANGFASALLMPKHLVSTMTSDDISWRNIKNMSDLCASSLEATFRRWTMLEKVSAAMVIHQNKIYKRFVASEQFDFYIERSNLGADQTDLIVNAARDGYPEGLDRVDPMDWVNPSKGSMLLHNLYVSCIELENGITYSLLFYDEDCLEDE